MRTYKSFREDFDNLSNLYVKKVEEIKDLIKEVRELHERLELMAKQYNEWKLEDNEGS